MPHLILYIMLIGTGAFAQVALATDYTNTNFIVRDPVVTIEGGRSETANFKYISSSGQTDTGENSNTNFIHRTGFLYFPAPPSPAPSPSPSAAGGGSRASSRLPFLLSELPLFDPLKRQGVSADLNGDGRVDLVDFSILVYWLDRPNPPAHIDLDGLGTVDLVDFSIMAYHWTG